jgi:hypothetical protein
LAQRIGEFSWRLRPAFWKLYATKFVATCGGCDRTQIEERLAFTRENYRIVRERLMKIVTWRDGDEGKTPVGERSH